MRLDELVEELESIFNDNPHLRECSVKVENPSGHDFWIDRVALGPDRVLIILET